MAMADMNMVSAGGFSGLSFNLRTCPQGAASVLCKKTPIFGSRRSKLDHLMVYFVALSLQAQHHGPPPLANRGRVARRRLWRRDGLDGRFLVVSRDDADRGPAGRPVGPPSGDTSGRGQHEQRDVRDAESPPPPRAGKRGQDQQCWWHGARDARRVQQQRRTSRDACRERKVGQEGFG